MKKRFGPNKRMFPKGLKILKLESLTKKDLKSCDLHMTSSLDFTMFLELTSKPL